MFLLGLFLVLPPAIVIVLCVVIVATHLLRGVNTREVDVSIGAHLILVARHWFNFNTRYRYVGSSTMWNVGCSTVWNVAIVWQTLGFPCHQCTVC